MPAPMDLVESMRRPNENPTEWLFRRAFLLRNWNCGLPRERMECLSNCFINTKLYGASYPDQLMEELEQRSKHLVQEVVRHRNAVQKAAQRSNIQCAIVPPCNKKGKLNDGSVSPSSSSSNGKVESSATNQSELISRILAIAGPMFRPINFVREGGCSTNPLDTYLGAFVAEQQATPSPERKRRLDVQDDDEKVREVVESITEQISACMTSAASTWALRQEPKAFTSSQNAEVKTLLSGITISDSAIPSRHDNPDDLAPSNEKNSSETTSRSEVQDQTSTTSDNTEIVPDSRSNIHSTNCSRDSMTTNNDDGSRSTTLEKESNSHSSEKSTTPVPVVLTSENRLPVCNEPCTATETDVSVTDQMSGLCVGETTPTECAVASEKSLEMSALEPCRIDLEESVTLRKSHSAGSLGQSMKDHDHDERRLSMDNKDRSSSNSDQLDLTEKDLEISVVTTNVEKSSEHEEQDENDLELALDRSSPKNRSVQQIQSGDVWVRRRVLFGNAPKSRSLEHEDGHNSEMRDQLVSKASIVGKTSLSITNDSSKGNLNASHHKTTPVSDEDHHELIRYNSIPVIDESMREQTGNNITVLGEDLDSSRNTPVIDEVSRDLASGPEIIDTSHPLSVSHPGIIFNPRPDIMYPRTPMVIYTSDPSGNIISQPGVFFPPAPQLVYRPPVVMYTSPQEDILGSHSRMMFERHNEFVHDSHFLSRQRNHSEESHIGPFGRRYRGRSEERHGDHIFSRQRGYSEESQRGYVSSRYRGFSEESQRDYVSSRNRGHSEESSFDHRSFGHGDLRKSYGNSNVRYDSRHDGKYKDQFERSTESRRSSRHERCYEDYGEENEDDYEEDYDYESHRNEYDDYYEDHYDRNRVSYYEDSPQKRDGGHRQGHSKEGPAQNGPEGAAEGPNKKNRRAGRRKKTGKTRLGLDEPSEAPKTAEPKSESAAMKEEPDVNMRTTVAATLSRFFQNWDNMLRRFKKENPISVMYMAANRSSLLLSCSMVTLSNQVKCCILGSQPAFGKWVLLATSLAPNRRKAKGNAATLLSKFIGHTCTKNDIEINPDDNQQLRLKLTVQASPDVTPGPAPSARPAPTARSPSPSRSTSSQSKCTTSAAPRVPSPVAVNRDDDFSTSVASSLQPHIAAYDHVYLKEVEKAAHQSGQILFNSSGLHNVPLTFETEGPNAVSLHFIGRAWGPCRGRGLALSKRLLFDTALQELRAKLWTMRVVPAPNFEVAKPSASGGDPGQKPLGPENVGHKLLMKMGWKGRGQGLGKDGQGRAEPPGLDVTVIRRAGIGHTDAGGAAFREYVRGRLHQFLCDPKGVDTEDLCFSPDFTSEERAFVHQECRRQPGVESRSYNSPDGRRWLVVMRRRTPRQLFEWVLRHGGQTTRYKLFPPGAHPSLTPKRDQEESRADVKD